KIGFDSLPDMATQCYAVWYRENAIAYKRQFIPGMDEIKSFLEAETDVPEPITRSAALSISGRGRSDSSGFKPLPMGELLVKPDPNEFGQKRSSLIMVASALKPADKKAAPGLQSPPPPPPSLSSALAA